MAAKVRIAGMQMEPKIMEKERNLTRCLELIHVAAQEGAQLVVFPECALTGYVYTSLEEALPMAEPILGPSTDRMLDACRELNLYVIVGLLEKHEDACYNTAALLGPQGLVGKHRKLHLPYLGVDRFVNRGDLPPIVFETELGRIGIGICYDINFPEYARVLALLGADIIVVPTNWPELSEFVPEYIIPTRAIENHVFCAAINRAGEERGCKFIGRSKISGLYGGSPLAEGTPYEEDVLYAEIEPTTAREKHLVVAPGEFEVHLVNDRRPEFYSEITRPLANVPAVH